MRSRSRFSAHAVAALAWLGATTPVMACSRHLITELQVADAGRNPRVTTRIDGAAVELFLDTGAEHTIVTSAVAARLRLATDWLGFQPLWGIGGLSVHFNAMVHRLEFGTVALMEQSLGVADFGPAWTSPVGGLLGADILGRYDVDVDFGHGRVSLYRAVRCGAPMPGWKAPAARVALVDVGRLRHLALAGATLDGRAMVATIDTGAEWTTVTTAAAARLGVTDAALARDADAEMVGVGSATRRFRIHHFDTLDFGGVVWRAPRLMVGALPPFLGDMLLGADFLHTHRIWVSWVNHTVFVALDGAGQSRGDGTDGRVKVGR